MVKEAAEHGVEFARNFVKREGWLGFVLIVGVAMLAWYVWQGHLHAERIAEILQNAHELQRQSLHERQEKTEALKANTEVLKALADRQDRAASLQTKTADNLAKLVQVATARLEQTKIREQLRLQQSERFLNRLHDTRKATQQTSEQMGELLKHIKLRDEQKDIERAVGKAVGGAETN